MVFKENRFFLFFLVSEGRPLMAEVLNFVHFLTFL